MANSFKQMIREKVIKRSDSGMFIRWSDLHVRPGFNKREDDERTRAGNEELFQFLAAGGRVPAIEVEPRDEGGVWIVEGHRRHGAYGRCIESGKPIEWIAITPFQGNDVDRVARIMTSNNQLPLTQFEQAMVVKELAGFNLNPEEISRHINKTRTTVDNLLILAYANHDVQELVRGGAVAADVAIDAVRKHGDEAGAFLQGHVDRASAMGKPRVTKALVKGPAIKRDMAIELSRQAKRLSHGLPRPTLDAIEAYRSGNITDPEHQVQVNVRDLLALVDCSSEIVAQLEEAERKIQEKMTLANAPDGEADRKGDGHEEEQ